MSADGIAGPFDGWLKGADRVERMSRQSHCGGASLFVSREEASVMTQGGGVRFVANEFAPEEGRGHMRVACNDEVMVKNGVSYALCSRCCGSELAIRTRLREQKRQSSSGERRPSSRRGDFDR